MNVDVPFELLLVAAFIGFAALAFLAARRQWQRWLAVGEALGLRPTEEPQGFLRGYPGFVGAHGGLEVRLRTYTTGSGKSQTRWTALEVSVPGPVPPGGLRVTREGWASALAKALGGQDVELGDPAFDEAFRLRADDPERARRLLGLAARARLLEVPRFGELRLDGPLGKLPDDPRLKSLLAMLAEQGPLPGEDAATVRYVRQELVTDADQLRPALQACTALAEAVRAERPLP